MPPMRRKRQHRKQKQSFHWIRPLALLGVVLIAAIILFIKNQPEKAVPANSEPAEVQLDYYLGEQMPTLAFFHSNNCHSCLVMVEMVELIHPEFAEHVALVDIDVYDPRNQNLLRNVGITTIPTMVFVNAKGEAEVITGIMEEAQLRQELQNIMGAN
jgi:thiol:disulfide interchange protein